MVCVCGLCGLCGVCLCVFQCSLIAIGAPVAERLLVPSVVMYGIEYCLQVFFLVFGLGGVP